MQKTRLLIILFAAVAFAASAASLYVHYQMLTDSSYTSFCDVSETVSCEAVYESAYGAVRGVPVAAGGVIWSALVLLLAFGGMRRERSAEADNVAEYVFLLSVVGLAVVLYLGYASYFVLNKVCLLCIATYAGVFGVFFTAAGATTMPFTTLPGRLLRDLRGLASRPAALTMGVLWLVASGSLVAVFPRQPDVAGGAPADHAATAPEPDPAAQAASGARVPTENQLAEFQKWYQAQPSAPIAAEADGARVVIIKFNDYQCPPCRQTFLNYKSILAKFQQSHPGQVKFITRDFPLESECNLGGVHEASCEAAAAVRMARETGKAEALEDWLFDNQPAMTPALVRQGVRQIAGVTDFDARYPAVLQQIRSDVKSAQALGVGRTPTFFINGRRIEGGLDAEFFEAAIAYELARSQGARP